MDEHPNGKQARQRDADPHETLPQTALLISHGGLLLNSFYTT